MDFNSKIIKSIGLEGKPSNHKIAVAMSGGVDSSLQQLYCIKLVIMFLECQCICTMKKLK